MRLKSFFKNTINKVLFSHKSKDDWRIEVVTDVISPVDSQSTVKAYKVTVSKVENETIVFTTPSPVALYFNIALTNYFMAIENRQKFEFINEVMSDNKIYKSVVKSDLRELYNYFENTMIVIISAFQGLEYYCNGIIGHSGEKNFEVNWRKKISFMNSLEMQKDLTISEKVERVLPKILKINDHEFDKEILKKLEYVKNYRNRIIHLKEHDAYIREEENGESNGFSIFYEFSYLDLKGYISNVLDIIEYFCKFNSYVPAWVLEIRKKIL
ncbi:hypothetical protein DLM76_20820 [Leptospira yasudae]|uniref:hypothetical protein n=1 Tax=Leptospira yasudae TaxID=2202201 RepID=UPI000E59AECE|nr:hypothetical protein [Leptospira yasudae]RHX90165.1 hypothetical protein DLM76_20820 [Leptospira yasudae]